MNELKRFQESIPNKDWPAHWIVAHRLLQPIEWNWSSHISTRQHLVSECRSRVRLVLPFTGGKMRVLMEQWLEEEKHSGLWE